MSDKSRKGGRKVESLLRRWGAEQAVAQCADTPAGPVSAGTASAASATPSTSADASHARRTSSGPTVWRWLPAVAAAILLTASAALLVLGRLTPPQPPGADLAVRQDLERLVNTAAALSDRLEHTQQELTTARSTISALEDNGRSLAQSVTEQRTAHEAELAKVNGSVQEARQQLAAATEKLATAEGQLSAATRKSAALEKQVAAAAGELTAAKNSLTQANEKLAALTAQSAADAKVLAAAQRAYLAGPAASDLTGSMASRARAMRDHRLLARLKQARAAAGEDDPTRPLLDQAEVLLTRLDVAEVSDAAAVAAVGEAIGRSGLVAKLELALWDAKAKPLPAATADLLLETWFVLKGADHAA
jgi:DNA repair exonuclease SbcCD ATPase subunit